MMAMTTSSSIRVNPQLPQWAGVLSLSFVQIFRLYYYDDR
jgi:hypothetical protein